MEWLPQEACMLWRLNSYCNAHIVSFLGASLKGERAGLPARALASRFRLVPAAYEGLCWASPAVNLVLAALLSLYSCLCCWMAVLAPGKRPAAPATDLPIFALPAFRWGGPAADGVHGRR